MKLIDSFSLAALSTQQTYCDCHKQQKALLDILDGRREEHTWLDPNELLFEL